MTRRAQASAVERPPWWKAQRSPQHRRLASALLDFGQELDDLRKAHPTPGTEQKPWLALSADLYAVAQFAASEHDVNAGWRALLHAYRVLVRGYAEAELGVHATGLRAEAADGKLRGWRGHAIRDLLADGAFDVTKVDAARTALERALELRDELSQNSYYKMALLAEHRRYLTIGLVLSLAAAFVLWALGALALGPITAVSEVPLPEVMLMGAVGAFVSALLSSAAPEPGQRIPEQLQALAIAVARPAIGSASALGVYMVLASGALTPSTGASVLAVSLAAGVTERLLLGALQTAGRAVA